MGPRILLFMLLLPVVEIYLLVAIGHATSYWVPFAIVIGSMLAGTAVVRHHGLRAFQRVRQDMAARQMPADSLLDAFLILVAGLLLIFPGVLTDLVGIALLVPPLRSLMKRGAKAWMQRHVEIHVARFGAPFGASGGRGASSAQDQIIDARVVNTRVEDAP
ncbi:MAG TPA: FxsA family protein [Lacipirellulaceae bacterium]|nr:FxsA family protein [Lacipirellulaceae bacterium]